MNKQLANLNDKQIRYGILFAGVLLMAAGVYRDEVSVVLRKAINICLECVGIG